MIKNKLFYSCIISATLLTMIYTNSPHLPTGDSFIDDLLSDEPARNLDPITTPKKNTNFTENDIKNFNALASDQKAEFLNNLIDTQMVTQEQQPSMTTSNLKQVINRPLTIEERTSRTLLTKPAAHHDLLKTAEHITLKPNRSNREEIAQFYLNQFDKAESSSLHGETLQFNAATQKIEPLRSLSYPPVPPLSLKTPNFFDRISQSITNSWNKLKNIPSKTATPHTPDPLTTPSRMQPTTDNQAGDNQAGKQSTSRLNNIRFKISQAQKNAQTKISDVYKNIMENISAIKQKRFWAHTKKQNDNQEEQDQEMHYSDQDMIAE